MPVGGTQQDFPTLPPPHAPPKPAAMPPPAKAAALPEFLIQAPKTPSKVMSRSGPAPIPKQPKARYEHTDAAIDLGSVPAPPPASELLEYMSRSGPAPIPRQPKAWYERTDGADEARIHAGYARAAAHEWEQKVEKVYQATINELVSDIAPDGLGGFTSATFDDDTTEADLAASPSSAAVNAAFRGAPKQVLTAAPEIAPSEPALAAAPQAAAAAAPKMPLPAVPVAPVMSPPGIPATPGSDRSHVVASPSSVAADTAAPSASAAAAEFLETLSERADEYDDEAAKDLLDAVLSSTDTRAIKSKEEIVKLFGDVSQRRNDFIQKLTIARGVAQPTGSNVYTQEQWRQWLSQTSLNCNDMKAAVAAWKNDFEITEFKQTAKVEQWRIEDTRDSKKRARELVNGAFRAHLKDLYGRPKLALAFLECPTAMVDNVLKVWREYMNSPGYQKERDCSRKDRTEEDKKDEVSAKVKVYRLRHQCRRCKILKRKLEERLMEKVPWCDQNMYSRYLDGSLENELDECTRIHGYGTLSTGHRIGAFGLKNNTNAFPDEY